MPVINGVYLKDFAALPGAVDDANIIPIAISGNQVAYRTTVSGIITDARITGKLLTGLSVTGTAILATDTILAAFGKVQNQLNNRVSSVGLTMPSAFSVANSPVTSSGTLAVTAAGLASQYIRGDGTLADFPTDGGGGGSSVSYYLNGSISQGTIGGNLYHEMNKTPVLGAGTDFAIASNGYIAQFLTDANDPNTLLIPAGNFNLEFYFSASSSGGTPSYYVELYKYDGATFTLIASNSTTPEVISLGTIINPYFSTLAVPETILLATDRLAIRVYVTNSGKTITMHTEDNHLCQIITTFTTGLQSLNGLSKQAQYFAVGSSGTDFAIVSSVDTHTFNIPTASASNRGLLSSANWTTFNNKQDALSGTGIVKSTSGVISYLTDNSTNWNTAYNDTIVSASVTGTTTKTLTLTQQDAGTITASWTDINTDAVSSVFGRTGAVIATSGDYTTAQVTESGNLYYTDARARASLSFVAGSGAYNSTTGVITIPTNNNQITNGAGYITSSALSSYLPLAGGTLTGALLSTNTTAFFLSSTGATTGGSGVEIANTGGHIRFGVEGSSGGTFFTGGSAYASVIGSVNATDLQFFTTSILRATITSAGIFTLAGALSGTSATFSGNGSSFGSALASGYPLTIQTNVSEQSIKFIGKNDNNNIQFFASNGSTYQAVVGTIGNDFIIGTGASGTTRLTIASTGAATFSSTVQTTGIGIGATPSGTQLINGTISTTNTLLELINTNASGYGAYIKAATGGTQYILRLVDKDSNTRFSFYGDGTSSFSGAATFTSSVTATSFFESSDSRLKILISDNYNAVGIESILPRLYEKGGVVELGYYAQDVQEVLPSAVVKRMDGFLDLSYRQVHTAKIANLENRIKQLENLIKQLL